MKFLHLDDDNLRHELFGEWAKEQGHESFHAHTIDEFAGLIDLKTFDVVFLDHDLNDFEHVSKTADMYGDCEANGTTAAHMLNALLPENRPSKVVIHSWNPDGANRMRAILEEGGFKDIEVTPFDDVAFIQRLLKWRQEGRQHKFLEWVPPEEKLVFPFMKNE